MRSGESEATPFVLSTSKHEWTKSTPSGVARQQTSFFCFAKRKKPKKRRPRCAAPSGFPCVARLVRRLRNSRYALRQSSPTTPDQSPLLGGAQGMEKRKAKPMCGHFVSISTSLGVQMKNTDVEKIQFGSWPMPESFLTELGRLVVMWSSLESLMDLVLTKLSGHLRSTSCNSVRTSIYAAKA